jgi:nucleotide-binding universal stress UspA family protein
MLVVGNRGRGALAELLLGSVAAGVVAHCAGPVMVVPGTPRDPGQAGPVVVGAGDAQTPTAWAFAYEAAAEHGTDLVVVRAWRPPAAWHSLGRPRSADDVDELETAERRAVWRALAPHGRRHAGVPVALRLVVAEPADALVRASAHARLVVVGARGRGTTAHRVIRRAGCPVAVVRERP